MSYVKSPTRALELLWSSTTTACGWTRPWLSHNHAHDHPAHTRCSTWNRGARHLACTSVPVQLGPLHRGAGAGRCRAGACTFGARCSSVQAPRTSVHAPYRVRPSPVALAYSQNSESFLKNVGNFLTEIQTHLTHQLLLPLDRRTVWQPHRLVSNVRTAGGMLVHVRILSRCRRAG